MSQHCCLPSTPHPKEAGKDICNKTTFNSLLCAQAHVCLFDTICVVLSCLHHIPVLLIEDSYVESLLAHEEDQGFGAHANRDGSVVTAFASDICNVVFIHQQVVTNPTTLSTICVDSH